jgi:G3E family GTPase
VIQGFHGNDGERDFPCNTILIAGFLGAGKTTLLRNILQWPGDLSKTAVLVNEFGRIGIDGELLKGFTSPVYELTNGCICCSIQGDLLRTVDEILNRLHPLRLLIEATGVADPQEIAGFLGRPRIRERIGKPTIVTVLSGDFWEGREFFGPLYYNQIKAADVLLFNKVDLVPQEDVPRYLEEIRGFNPSCIMVPTHHCRIEPDILWSLGPRDREAQTFHMLQDHSDHESAQGMGFLTFSFEESIPFRPDCFRRFVEELPIKLYRLKGFALLGDERFFLNHAGGRTEWSEVQEAGPTRLAFVGWDVKEEDILDTLQACLDRAHPSCDGRGEEGKEVIFDSLRPR